MTLVATLLVFLRNGKICIGGKRMAHHRYERRTQIPSLLFLIVVTLLTLLMMLSVSGCLSQQEITYQDQFRQILDRYNDMAKNYQKIDTDFINQLNAITESAKTTGSVEAMPDYQRLVSTYLPQFQQYQLELQRLQADSGAVQAPSKYASAHSILNSGISITISAVSERMRAIGLIVQPSNWPEVNAAINSAISYSDQGSNTIDQAKHMVFPFPWGFVLGGSVVVLVMVAGIIILIIYLKRKRRQRPRYTASSPADSNPYPISGYQPPPMDYRPPSEAYDVPPRPDEYT
jgi:hypothetical protein